MAVENVARAVGIRKGGTVGRHGWQGHGRWRFAPLPDRRAGLGRRELSGQSGSVPSGPSFSGPVINRSVINRSVQADPFSPLFPLFPTPFPPSADAKHRLFLRTLDTASGTARIPPRRRLPSGQRRQSGRRRNSCCGAGLAADLINHLVQAGPFCRCVLPYPLRVIDAVQAERLRPAFLMQPVDTSPDALVQRL